MRKKYIFVLLFIFVLFVFISFLINNYMFRDISLKNNCYFIINHKSNNVNYSSIKYYIDRNDYIYLGVSTNTKNASKLSKAFNSLGLETSILESYISNDEFVTNLIQYDNLLSNIDKNSDLISISEVILSSYEDLVLNN